MHENKLDCKKGYKDEKPIVTTHFNCFVVVKWMKKREWNVGGYFWFDLIFIKNIIKLIFFKSKLVQIDRFWFGYFRIKTSFFRFG